MHLDDTATEHLTQHQVMEMVAAAEARKSKMIALMVAIWAHVLLVGGLVYMVFGEAFVREPNLIISAPYSPVEQLKPTKKDLLQVKTERPSAPSSSMTKVIVAHNAVSAIALPVIDEFVDTPMNLGSGFGQGMVDGMGGMGGTGGGGSFFGTPAAGKSVILVLDTSTSMDRECGESGIAAIRLEIERTINSFQPTIRFNIICFGNLADGFKPKPVPATSSNKKAAIAFTKDYYTRKGFTRTRTGDNLDPKGEIPYVPIRPEDFKATKDTSGGSRYDLALIAAFDQHPETIFLLTDGKPSPRLKGQSLSDRDILAIVKKAGKRSGGRQRTVVNGISVNSIAKSFLENVTKAFRGKVSVIEPKKL